LGSFGWISGSFGLTVAPIDDARALAQREGGWRSTGTVAISAVLIIADHARSEHGFYLVPKLILIRGQMERGQRRTARNALSAAAWD
jgi:hypothetical protein